VTDSSKYLDPRAVAGEGRLLLHSEASCGLYGIAQLV